MKMKIYIILIANMLVICYNGYSQDNYYRTALYIYGGIPQLEHVDTSYKVLINTTFAVGYSDDLKNPIWVAFRYGNKKGVSLFPKWKRPYDFRVDLRTNSKVTHDDYTSSGYDRGHLAPNAAMLAQYGQMAQLETYFMSNISPQTPELNRGIWQRLEAKIGENLSQDDRNNKEVHDLFVVTGPIFEAQPPDTLDSGVSIPTHFFKIISFQKGYSKTVKAIAFIFPQDPISNDLLDYATTVDEIEVKTGINFAPELSTIKQDNLESRKRNFELEEIQ